MGASGAPGDGGVTPDRRRLTVEDLDPAPRSAVTIADFGGDLRAGPPAAPVQDRPVQGRPSGDRPSGDRPSGHEPVGRGRDETGRDEPARSSSETRVSGRSEAADLDGLVDLDGLEPVPPREPPAELGRLAEGAAAAEGAPQLTMDDLRFGRRGRSGRTGEGGPGQTGRVADPDRQALPPGGGRARPRPAPPHAEGGEEPPEDTRSPEEREAEAKEICLRLLTDRARTKHELGSRLRQKGVATELAERVLDRFDEVGLIDDEAFAGAWVRARHRHRGLGRRAIAQELRRKGVATEIAEEALTEVDDEAEASRARELVDRRLRTMTIRDADERRRAAGRLVGMLARKGYPSGIAYGVVRSALAELGAEDEELGPPDPD